MTNHFFSTLPSWLADFLGYDETHDGKAVWYTVDHSHGEKPVNRVLMNGEQIIDFDVSSGWQITDVCFDDKEADEHEIMVVVLEKRKDKDGASV